MPLAVVALLTKSWNSFGRAHTGAVGTLIAKNLTGGGESHLFLFQGNLPVVPEPTTLAMSLFGAAALIGVELRWRACRHAPIAM